MPFSHMGRRLKKERTAQKREELHENLGASTLHNYKEDRMNGRKMPRKKSSGVRQPRATTFSLW